MAKKLTKKEKLAWAVAVRDMLDEAFPDPKVPLDHTDHYSMLVAVLLSAQCTDVRVNQTTPKLWAKAADPASMVELGEEAILDIVRPCGLGPRNASAIYRLSQILIDQHNGEVPSSRADLEALPGIGRKSANVILSTCFNEPAFAVDTHIIRTARRWRLSEAKSASAIERDLCALFPKDSWNKLHLQFIYYARTYCPARGHILADCAICSEASERGYYRDEE